MDTRLSLERPYKNDQGLPIPVLQDITQQGELIYEPYEHLVFILYPC